MSTDELLNSVRTIVQKNKDLQEGYDRLKEEKAILKMQLEKARSQIADLQTKVIVSAGKHNYMVIAMRLRKMGLRYRNIRNIFKIGTTVLSGGFVLQTILGEYWHTDLDIFTTDALKVIEELSKHCVWVTQPYVIDSMTTGSYEGYPGLQIIERVYRGEIIKGVYIEIIESRDPIQNIRDFDFDFCKCYFDGSFHVMNPQSVATKTCWISQFKQARADKYRLRGFAINIGTAPKFETGNNSENEELPISEMSDYNDYDCCGCEN